MSDAGAFFHEGLAARWQARGVDGWLAPRLVDAQPQVAEAFAASGIVVVDGAIAPMRAVQLELGLESAAFVPHHHGPYPLHIAPRPAQRGVLADFMDWLARPRTARMHLGLVGLPPDRKLVQTQVQISRMRAGEFFPQHVDTSAPALACIYNFTRGYDEQHGGALRFENGFAVAPRFNSACFFVTSGVPHEVTPVTHPQLPRYSATVFYVWQTP